MMHVAGLSELNSDLDIGQDSCALFLLTSEERNGLRPLSFVNNLKYKAMQLADLIEEFNLKASTQLKKKLVSPSVAKWIFYTNQIEFAGLPSEADTEECITGARIMMNGTVEEKEVLQTLALLRETWSKPGPITEKAFDTIKLRRWHQTLFLGLLKQPGEFRTSGVQTNNLDGTTHNYPHHKIITKALTLLGRIVVNLEKEISIMESLHIRLMYTIGLAAFAQFHFVDIHPFIDGNGRICRFLSKYILDCELPLPFPMFTNRQEYLVALIKGRTLPASQVPEVLAGLLMDSAIKYYQQILKDYVGMPFEILIFVSDMKELEEEILRENISPEIAEQLRQAFPSLEGYVDIHKVRLRKDTISIDEL